MNLDSAVQCSPRRGGSTGVLRRKLGWWLGWGVGVLAASVAAGAAAPQVVVSQPRSGDLQVDPQGQEIVITFDQDMDPAGYSFTHAGAAFPKVTGKARWRTARECVLPVELEPGRAYAIGINSATHRNFKGANGVPVAPVVLTFRTRGAAGGGTPALTAEQASAAVGRLRRAVTERYAYRDVHGLDWAEAWRRFEPRLLAARSPREWAETAGELLAGTRDVHIWLQVGGETVPAYRRDVRPNVDPRLLPGLIRDWQQPHPQLAVGRAAPQVGYLAIHSWERRHAPQLVDGALAALRELRELPALVLDVRMNAGGDERLARQFAGAFVRTRVRYARHVPLDPTAATGWGAPVDRWLDPLSDPAAYAGRVVVLMGRVNMSTAESFLLMMRQVPGARLVGEQSYGASGNPQPHDLGGGVTVLLPSWQAQLPDGSLLETKGVTPDVAVPTAGEGPAAGDPVLAAALALLER